MPDTSINVHQRAETMLRNLKIIEVAHGYKPGTRAYDGKVRQMKGDLSLVHL